MTISNQFQEQNEVLAILGTRHTQYNNEEQMYLYVAVMRISLNYSYYEHII